MSRMRIEEVEIRDADIFEILLDNFPDMIHSIDDNGNIIYTNKTAETLLGYAREELLAMNIRQIYSDKILNAMEAGFSDLKQTGDKTIPESLLKTKDGQEIPVEIRSFSIYDDEGNFIRTFSILRDIRDIKQLQQELVHAGRLAAIGELSSGVAHDINNPLTVILLSNEMNHSTLKKIQNPSDTPIDRLLTHTEGIAKASKSIQKLADHLRNFSRGMAEATEKIDLFESISDALFITHSKIQKSGVNESNEVKKGVHFVEGRSNQLEQVFVNLISNACDAMLESEERKLTIGVHADTHEGLSCWRCDITDTGKGIPEDLMEDIFHSFFTTKEKGKGTGLGLSISRGIIADHKGHISVKSTLGAGTTFSVFLPQAESND